MEKTLQDKSVKGIIACNNSSTKATIAAVMKEGRKDLAVMGFDLSEPAVAALKMAAITLLPSHRIRRRWGMKQ